MTQSWRFASERLLAVCMIVLVLGASWRAYGQGESKEGPERQRALELYKAGKFVEAMPLLEELAADLPSDSAIRESWAYCVAAYAATLSDPDLRRKARIRARTIARQARDLGDNSDLLQILLDIPEDGSEPSFSKNRDVDTAMKMAEADFARGDFDKAREGYLRAMLLDPGNYFPPLFIGDVYFNQHDYESAGEWFARAVQVDPNRETAYRYWGDALSAQGKSDEARAKYIEAVVAEPYNHTSWVGLTQWANRNHVELQLLQFPNESTAKTDEKGTTITLDSTMLNKSDSATTAAWIAYGARRALWQKERYKKEYPQAPAYRHSLREEADSLRVMLSVLSELSQKDKGGSADPSLAELAKIDQAGLLEPYVLIGRADAGIAQDYSGYRDAHREKIRRYLDEFVVPRAPLPSR
jgi:tetratricopeptide (TPR) repeat protein